MDTEREIQAIDRGAPKDLARLATREPAFAVADWGYRSIYALVMSTTGGVYRFNGEGRARGEWAPWSMVL
jgi:hypothetical protein